MGHCSGVGQWVLWEGHHMDDQVDASLEGDEVELTAGVMDAANRADHHLTSDETDTALGLRTLQVLTGPQPVDAMDLRTVPVGE